MTNSEQSHRGNRAAKGAIVIWLRVGRMAEDPWTSHMKRANSLKGEEKVKKKRPPTLLSGVTALSRPMRSLPAIFTHYCTLKFHTRTNYTLLLVPNPPAANHSVELKAKGPCSPPAADPCPLLPIPSCWQQPLDLLLWSAQS